MSEPTWTPGQFVWRELLTQDVAASKDYYSKLFGWSFMESPANEGYFLITPPGGEKPIAGMLKIPMEGVPSHWLSYVSSDDVAASCARVTASGGKIFVPPKDVPNVGTFSVMADRTGAMFAVYRSASGDPQPGMPGEACFCWETLMSSDKDAAKAFYGEAMGWKTEESGHVIFKSGDAQVADLEGTPPGVPDHWLTHVVTKDVAASLKTAEEHGGTVVMPATPIPGIGQISCIRDPQGAHICPFQPEMG